jgi:copper(I)-binding protein
MNRLVIAAALLLASCGQGRPPSDLKLSDGWARETVPGQTTGAAYLVISNNGTGEDRLVGASSAAADHAMVHESSAVNGVARMRHLDDGLGIPSKAALQLAPGGAHVMLIGLKKPLEAGETIPVELQFERSRPISIDVKVLDAATAGRQSAN